MSLSSYLPCGDSFDAEASAANKSTMLLVAHGTEDPVVPYERGAGTRDLLQQAGYTVEWREYPMPHSVCLEEVRDISKWLVRTLSR